MLSVLVIEDEPSFVEALEVAFEREGFSMRSAEDGRNRNGARRRKLEGVEGAPVIETVRGVGYRLTVG